MRRPLIIGLFFFLSGKVWGYGIGASAYPLLPDAKMVGAELTGIFSKGGGLGVQGRFIQKVTRATVFDFGVGMNGGERSGSLFLGIDHELFPDYGYQPKISFRAAFESASEFGSRNSILSFAPTFSKGLSFWGTEAYPFLSLPVGIGLNTNTKTYQSRMGLSLGFTGNLPFQDYKDFVGVIEASFDIKDTFSGIFFGLSYPLR